VGEGELIPEGKGIIVYEIGGRDPIVKQGENHIHYVIL
jgi:hypothetical protein